MWSPKSSNTSTLPLWMATRISVVTRLYTAAGVTAKTLWIGWKQTILVTSSLSPSTSGKNKKNSGAPSPPQRKWYTGPMKISTYLCKTTMSSTGGVSVQTSINWQAGRTKSFCPATTWLILISALVTTTEGLMVIMRTGAMPMLSSRESPTSMLSVELHACGTR